VLHRRKITLLKSLRNVARGCRVFCASLTKRNTSHGFIWIASTYSSISSSEDMLLAVRCTNTRYHRS